MSIGVFKDLLGTIKDTFRVKNLKLDASALTALRTIKFADANQNLGFSDTWENRPNLAALGVGRYRITNVGINGSDWYYDGSTWSQTGPIIITKKTLGYIAASLTGATYSQTGTAITVTLANHRLTAALNGRYIYLTGTGGIIPGWYQFTYVDSSNFTCYWPVSQTISGNISNTNGEYIFDIANTSLPSGFFSGRFAKIEASFRYESGAVSTKAPRLYLNNTLLLSHNIANNVSASVLAWFLTDNGSNSQVASLNSGNYGTGTIGTFSENTTTASCTIRVAVNLTSNFTWACLDLIEIIV